MRTLRWTVCEMGMILCNGVVGRVGGKCGRGTTEGCRMMYIGWKYETFGCSVIRGRKKIMRSYEVLLMLRELRTRES